MLTEGRGHLKLTLILTEIKAEEKSWESMTLTQLLLKVNEEAFTNEFN